MGYLNSIKGTNFAGINFCFFRGFSVKSQKFEPVKYNFLQVQIFEPVKYNFLPILSKKLKNPYEKEICPKKGKPQKLIPAKFLKFFLAKISSSKN